MTTCPNPSLVPMTPAKVSNLAEKRIEYLKQLRKKEIDNAIAKVLTYPKWTKDKGFWKKPRYATVAEATEWVLALAKDDRSLCRSGDCWLSAYDMAREAYITSKLIQKMRGLVSTTKLVAHGCDMWIDIETAELLARYEDK